MDDPRESKNGITPTRIGIWVVGGAIGLYLIVSGLIGALGGGSWDPSSIRRGLRGYSSAAGLAGGFGGMSDTPRTKRAMSRAVPSRTGPRPNSQSASVARRA